MVDQSPFWASQAHADRRPVLMARARIVTALREWFAAEGFVEIETGVLQVSPGNETHLHAFATDLISPAGAPSRRYLRTSPEFACKKLLAAGEPLIVEFAKAFRNRERGPLHAPEFTLLEWYRARAPYTAVMQDCAGLVAIAAQVAGAKRLTFRERACDVHAEPEWLTVFEAFQRYADLDLAATLSGHDADRDAFAAAARTAGITIAADDTWGDIFSRVLVALIEPRLGLGRATFLYEYPAVLSALAQPKPSDLRVAERFELYVCGVELANGFGELNDAAEQRRRLTAEMAEKQRIYGERYPLDEDFLAALTQMPPACGVALGLDRLVMLATGAPHIDHVLWTPPVEA
ncbi:MAG TPA: EF-P lysine aminoacylase EpmA [Xanthobacteraceae bacterium]|nr:EF-P lysine aminoacylase EpmA [Xanthobacteraceae bacterium]